jgi:hypothetical protein
VLKRTEVLDARATPLERMRIELERFSEEQRVGVARGLALLWEAFVGQYGGLDGFSRLDGEQRQAYLGELQRAGDAMTANEALVRSRYAISPAVIVLYVETLAAQDKSESARKFGRAVATLIDMGRAVRARSKTAKRT